MSKAISSVAFGAELIRSDPDYFCKDASVAVATGPAVVVEKALGDLQGGVEIVVVANDAGTLSTSPLVVTINRAPTAGGAKTAVRTFTVPVGALAAGAVIGRFIPGPGDNGFYSVAFTSNVKSSGSIDVFQHPVAR